MHSPVTAQHPEQHQQQALTVIEQPASHLLSGPVLLPHPCSETLRPGKIPSTSAPLERRVRPLGGQEQRRHQPSLRIKLRMLPCCPYLHILNQQQRQ